MLKPNRKYFPQQPTSGSWKCWCLPGMRPGPAHGVSPRPSPAGLSLHGAPPTPPSQPGSVLPEPRPCSRLRPQPRPHSSPRPRFWAKLGYTSSQTNPTSEEP
ncbi:hypothetical protein LEMLEM_LOCUS8491, partial [Lemmus lemmus]